MMFARYRKIMFMKTALLLAVAVFAGLFSGCSFGRKVDEGGEKVSADTPWFDCKVTDCEVKRENTNVFAEDQISQYPIGKISDGYVYALNVIGSDIVEVYLYSGEGTRTAELDLFAKVEELYPDLSMPEFRGAYDLYLQDGKLKLKIDNQSDMSIMLFDVDLLNGTVELSATYSVQSSKPSGYNLFSVNRVKCGENELFVSLYENFCILSVGPDGKTSIYNPGPELEMDLSGYVSDLLPVSDTQALFFDYQTQKYFLYDVTSGKLSKDTSEYDWIKPYFNWYRPDIRYNTGSNGEIYFITPDAVAVPDFGKKCFNNLILLENMDINRAVFASSGQKYCYVANANEESAEFIVMDYMPEKDGCGFEIYNATKAKTNPHAGKRIITTDGFYKDVIYTAIWTFNRTDKDYYIKIVPNIYTDAERSANTSDKPAIYTRGEVGNRMMVDLMAGDCPDVVFYVTSYGQLNNGNCMMDLKPYLESGKMKNQVFDNIVKACENDGCLYAMPLSFVLDGIIVDRTKCGFEGNGMTFDQFGQFTDSYCNGLNVISNSRTGFMGKCLNYQYDVVEQNGTVNFDCTGFRAMAEFTRDHVNDVEINDYWNSFTRSSICSNNTCIEGYLGWFSEIKSAPFGYGDADLIGFPSADGRGPAANIRCFVSVTQGSKCPIGAWRFIETLLSEDVQKSLCSQTGTFQNEFPLNRKAFDEVGADCVDIFNHQIDQEYSWQTGADKSSLYTKKDDLNTLKKVAESLDHIYKSDADIDIIVFEEIQPYLAGDKSLDEVIKIMNDRARTVMNERR